MAILNKIRNRIKFSKEKKEEKDMRVGNTRERKKGNEKRVEKQHSLGRVDKVKCWTDTT